MITVYVRFGILYIGDRLCTFDTKEIREELEKIGEASEPFYLPLKYVVDVVPSETHGTVAKISLQVPPIYKDNTYSNN